MKLKQSIKNLLNLETSIFHIIKLLFAHKKCKLSPILVDTKRLNKILLSVT